MGQSKAIYDVCSKTMGGVGIALAMIGVVICPITSGDTAFRSARLTLADWLKIDQDSYANRLKLCIPVLGVGRFPWHRQRTGLHQLHRDLALLQLDQPDAGHDRSVGCIHVPRSRRRRTTGSPLCPATFMSAVSSTYFILAPECLGGLLNSQDRREGATIYNNTAVAYPIGVIFAIAMLAVFLHATKKAAQKA